jgi:hypothetical protein
MFHTIELSSADGVYYITAIGGTTDLVYGPIARAELLSYLLLLGVMEAPARELISQCDEHGASMYKNIANASDSGLGAAVH